MLLLDSEAVSAIDAFIVAVADVAGGALVATVNVADLRALVANASDVSVADIRAA